MIALGSRVGAGARALAERALARGRRRSALAELLGRAGLDVAPADAVVVVAGSSAAAMLLGLAAGGPLVALGLGALTVAGFVGWVRRVARRRRARFAEQLGPMLELLASSLRAGLGLGPALDTLVEEVEPPGADELRRLLLEARLGRPLEEALQAMADRMASRDLHWVARAVEIQRDVGGDLAGILDGVAGTIRERARLRRQVAALGADGRLSAVILMALPPAVLTWVWLVTPGYLDDLTGTALGRLLLAVAAVLLVAGGVWIRRVVRVTL